MLEMKARMPREIHGDGRYVVAREQFQPAYLKTHAEGKLSEKVEQALAQLADCTVCPRDCHIDRWRNKIGVCKSGRLSRVASHFPHFGEEDVLRGWRGSGTIFFSWCNLRCVFCQNYDASQQGVGREVTARELAALMIELQDIGCHNINFVTPEHVVPQLLEALPLAIDMGLRLPIVYNTSSYDSLESMRVMEGIVDIYMPDFKMWEPEHARKYLLAPNYPEVARAVVKEMHRQVGDLIVDEQGLALRGLIVRHLVMPGLLNDTRRIMRYLAEELSQETFVNIMDQYYPAWRVKTEDKYAEINRHIYPEELQQAFAAAREAGLWRFDSRWRKLSPLALLGL